MHGKTFYSVLVCDSSTLENAVGDKPESNETKNGKLQVLPATPDQSLVEYLIASLSPAHPCSKVGLSVPERAICPELDVKTASEMHVAPWIS